MDINIILVFIGIIILYIILKNQENFDDLEYQQNIKSIEFPDLFNLEDIKIVSQKNRNPDLFYISVDMDSDNSLNLFNNKIWSSNYLFGPLDKNGPYSLNKLDIPKTLLERNNKFETNLGTIYGVGNILYTPLKFNLTGFKLEYNDIMSAPNKFYILGLESKNTNSIFLGTNNIFDEKPKWDILYENDKLEDLKLSKFIKNNGNFYNLFAFVVESIGKNMENVKKSQQVKIKKLKYLGITKRILSEIINSS